MAHRELYRYLTFRTGRLISFYERYSPRVDKTTSQSILGETSETRVVTQVVQVGTKETCFLWIRFINGCLEDVEE